MARATGGLAEQVIDIDAESGKATGLLFREKVPRGTDLAQEWRKIQVASHPRPRKASILYEALTEALVEALVRAIEIYQTEPERYEKVYDKAVEK